MRSRLFFLIISYAFCCYSQSAFIDSESIYHQNITSESSFFVDTACSMSFEQISSLPVSAFTPASHSVKPGFHKIHLWMRVKLHNNSSNDNFVVSSDNNICRDISLFVSDTTHSTYKHLTRNPASIFPEFFVSIPSGKSKYIYLKLASTGKSFPVNILVSDPNAYSHAAQVSYILSGLFYGILILFLVQMIFYYRTLKYSLYFFYSLHIFSCILIWTAFDGLLFCLPISEIYMDHTALIFIRIFNISSILFILNIISPKPSSFNWFFKLSIAYFSVLTLIQIFGPSSYLPFFQHLSSINSSITLLLNVLLLAIFYKRVKYASLYFASYGALFIGVFAYSLQVDDIIHLPIDSFLFVKFGNTIELLTISFAVALLFKQMDRDIKSSQGKINNLQQHSTHLEHLNMQLQMNPHFIFNALNNIQYQISNEDYDRAYQNVYQCSSLIRATLENAKIESISIQNEIEYLKKYIDLKRSLSETDFRYTLTIGPDIDPDILHFPSMLIQPFIENSFEHGLIGQIENGLIKLNFQLRSDFLEINIYDNGVGFIPEVSTKREGSYALQLAQNRIRAMKKTPASPYSLIIHSVPDKYTKITLKVPFSHAFPNSA